MGCEELIELERQELDVLGEFLEALTVSL